MTNHAAAERAHVAAWCDYGDALLEQATQTMRAELDHLKESWSSGFEQQLADHQARMTEIREAAEGARTDVRQTLHGASPLGNPVPPVAGPAGPPAPDPRQLELDHAQAIKDMSLEEFAQRRAELGVRSPTDMSHLFGKEPPR